MNLNFDNHINLFLDQYNDITLTENIGSNQYNDNLVYSITNVREFLAAIVTRAAGLVAANGQKYAIKGVTDVRMSPTIAGKQIGEADIEVQVLQAIYNQVNTQGFSGTLDFNAIKNVITQSQIPIKDFFKKLNRPINDEMDYIFKVVQGDRALDANIKVTTKDPRATQTGAPIGTQKMPAPGVLGINPSTRGSMPYNSQLPNTTTPQGIVKRSSRNATRVSKAAARGLYNKAVRLPSVRG